MKDGEPENVYHFLTHEVRFVNYFISDYAKTGNCEDMQKQHKSNFIDTVSTTLMFYETVFDENKAVWEKFYQRMKQSCNITIVETYPTAKDYDIQRVIAAITFWYSDNSVVINIMGVAVEDKDLSLIHI